MRGRAFVIFFALAQLEFGAETVDPAVSSRVMALNADGSALVGENRYAEAEVAYRAALQACEAPVEVSHCPELPVVLSNLGAVYFHAGRYREAELRLVRALAFWTSNAKPSEDLRNALYNLATVYRNQARYTEAAPLYERALAVNDELVGQTKLSNLPLLNGIGLFYADTAEYARAQQIMERAMSILHLRHAENTPDAATCFGILGTILEAQGSANEAEKWFLRALKIREHLFGQNDPAVADTRVGLALVYHRESRLAEAADLNMRAIAAYQERHEAKTFPSHSTISAGYGPSRDA